MFDIIIFIVIAVISLVMLSMFIGIHGDVKRIRQIEDAKFMIFLRHADVTPAELDGIWRAKVLSKNISSK